MEPVTTLTDFTVAIVCWVAFYKFYQIKNSASASYKWFRSYFLIFAIGMTSAAWFGHGLQAYVTPRYKVIGWACGATGLMFLQFGSFQLIRKNIHSTLEKVLPVWFLVQYATVLFLMINPATSSFKVTQVNSVIALIGTVLPMHLFALKKVGVQGSKIILGALIYSAIPGIIYSNQISIDRWFNYHDISHVLMAIFMTIMFMGLYSIIKPTET